MKIKYIHIYLCVFFALFAQMAIGQDDCTIKLTQAQKLYEEGKIEKIPGLLSECLQNGFNKENKVTALRLLTLVYLFDDNTEMAEKSLVEMLSYAPEYQVNPNVDPVEFIRLYGSFRTAPVFSLGAVINMHSTLIRLIQTYTTHDYNNANSKYNSGGMGLSFGLRAMYHISPKLHLTLEPMYSSYSFDFSKNVGDFGKNEGTQSIKYFEIPLIVSYDFAKKGDFTFYGEGGFTYGQYLAGSIDLVLNYTNPQDIDQSGSSLDAAPAMRTYNVSGNIGVGTKFHIPHGNIQVGIRYNIGLNNLTNNEAHKVILKTDNTPTTGTIGESYNKYQYAFDDYGLSSFGFSIGYNYEFFIHKKKNKR
jgi:hypothetical protein